MAKLPEVAGLVKHQVYLTETGTAREQSVVMTLWTWKNEDPVLQARIDSEQAAIMAWAQAANTRATYSNIHSFTWIKSWDMGQTPPSRFPPFRIWPRVQGSHSQVWTPRVTCVMALRTQATGSAIRNRLNGRIHHRYPPLLELSGGAWSSSWRTTIQNAYTVLLTALNPAAAAVRGTWVVPCWVEGGAPRVGGPLLPAVNHILCRPDPGTVKSTLKHPGPYARGA